MQNNLYLGEEARNKIVLGIKKAAQAVGSTMGTKGSNAIIEAIESPGYLNTNDGISILQAMRFGDPLEELGRKILLEAVSRANKQSGDGSSTATVLTAAIIEEGMKFIKEGITPIDIKRSIEQYLPALEEAIRAQSTEITTDTVASVATISAEDESIGSLIQEIYQQIGKDGIVYWDVSKTAEDSYSLGEGITIHGAGYMSPYMCDADASGQNTNQIRLKNPKILITKQKIASALDFESIGLALNADGITDLVIFADDVEPLVTNDLVKTRMMRGFRFIIVKMPTLWKDHWFTDIALASGATVIDPQGGRTLKEATLADLGSVNDIIITAKETFIDGIKDITQHVEQLKEENTEESLHRASRLNTKTARYYVGAPSESALSYRRLKVEDAISAAYQALHGGIVPGGGVALVEASRVLSMKDMGGLILAQALAAPARQIAHNAGVEVDLLKFTDTIGFDSHTRTYTDMKKAGIVNPTNVEVNALRNAISVAATALSAPTVITLPHENQAL